MLQKQAVQTTFVYAKTNVTTWCCFTTGIGTEKIYPVYVVCYRNVGQRNKKALMTRIKAKTPYGMVEILACGTRTRDHPFLRGKLYPLS